MCLYKLSAYLLRLEDVFLRQGLVLILGLFKGDLLNQIKGQVNYLGSNLNKSKVKSNIWAKD